MRAVIADDAPAPTQLGVLARRLVADPAHGPLPAFMLVLTALTGVVDAVSILSLGRVFVANMTGNIVFVGFGLAGAPGFVLSASLSALGGFILGAIAARPVVRAAGAHRGRFLAAVAAAELALLLVALAALAVDDTPDAGVREGVAAVMAFAMGLQNTAVRHLKVLDMLTTVLTSTLIGIVGLHDDEDRTAIFRRLLTVLAMFLGALFGALLVVQVSAVAALALGVVLLLVVAVGAARASREAAAWHAPRS